MESTEKTKPPRRFPYVEMNPIVRPPPAFHHPVATLLHAFAVAGLDLVSNLGGFRRVVVV
jgi:hypothetical protein